MSEDVFILGAGFSKAISEHMPTLADLSKSVMPQLEELRLTKDKLPQGDNIEKLLSFLAQRHPWLTESEQLRNRAAFLELSKMIGKGLEELEKVTRTSNFPQWFTDMVKKWHEKQTDVITFNYDTLIESEAKKIEVPTTSNHAQKEKIQLDDLYPVTITPIILRFAGSFSGEAHQTFKLYKLHGSINWHYSGSTEYYGESIYKTELDRDSKEILVATRDKVPLIIPPTLDKTMFFNNETVRSLWRGAGQALGEAKRVFCLGYSFPLTDMMVQFFIQTNHSNQETTFYWINIENHENRENNDPKKDEALRNILPDSYKINTKYTCEKAIPIFVDDYIEGRVA